MTATVFQPLTLASCATLGNRIVKAAMEENMAMPGQLPGKSLFELYSQWARGGAGLLITGNVMVDRLAMTGPGGVALEADAPLTPFREWAEVVHRAGSQIWMQINHPGRQVFRRMGGRNLAPSAVGLEMGKHFAVAVKLNSADFQRGGFDIEDAHRVIDWLSSLKVDVVELSGGSYESPAMQGRTADGRTLAREAYFLEFAKTLTQSSTMPLMVTGGIRRLPVAQDVLDSGVALVGMASALAQTPDLPVRWQQDPEARSDVLQLHWKDKTLSGLANMAMIRRQLRRMGAGRAPARRLSAIVSILMDQVRLSGLTRSYRRHLKLD